MKDYGNIFWFILGGEVIAAFWAILGLIFCATVVGIPCGKQLFKVAKFSLAPFGVTPSSSSNDHPLTDLLWLPLGIPIMLFFIFLGLAYTVTIVGIPLGKQCFKFIVLSMGPFGVEFEAEEDDTLPPREEY